MRKKLIYFLMSMIVIVLSMSSSLLLAEAKSPVTVTFWSMRTAEHERKALLKMIKMFEKENPGIKVSPTWVPWAPAIDKTIAAATTGTLPDSSIIGGDYFGDFAAMGIFEILDSYIANWDQKDNIYVDPLEPGPGNWYKGHVVCLPLEVGTMELVYNKKMFKEAGILSPPKTWNEFIVDAAKLTNPEKGVYGWGQAGWTSQGYLPWLCIVAQHNPFSAHHTFTPTGDIAFDNPIGYKMMEFWVDAYAKFKVTSRSMPVDGMREMFLAFSTQKSAMMFTEPRGTGSALAAGVSIGTAPLPGGPVYGISQVRKFSTNGNVSIGIFNTSKHKKEAWKWVSFMLSPKAQVIWASAIASFPANLVAAQDPVFKNNPLLAPSYDAIKNRYLFKIPHYPGAADVGYVHAKVAMQNALLGKWTPEEAVKYWANEIRKKMKQASK